MIKVHDHIERTTLPVGDVGEAVRLAAIRWPGCRIVLDTSARTGCVYQDDEDQADEKPIGEFIWDDPLSSE